MKNQLALVLAVLALGTGCARMATPSQTVSAQAERAVVTVTGEGVVSSDGIDCGVVGGERRARCSASWVSFDGVRLTATAEPGWHFVGWRAERRELSPAQSEAASSGYRYEAHFERVAEVAAR